MRRLIRAVAGVAVLVLATASPATAGREAPTVPFRGSVVTYDQPMTPPTDCPPPAEWRYTSVGPGVMTHLGKVEVAVTHCSWMTGPTTGVYDYSDVVITAANGDTLTVEHSGTWELTEFGPDGPTTSVVHGTWTITGGTGRFAGATGSGTMSGVDDLVGGIMSSRWDGVIAYAASAGAGR